MIQECECEKCVLSRAEDKARREIEAGDLQEFEDEPWESTRPEQIIDIQRRVIVALTLLAGVLFALTLFMFFEPKTPLPPCPTEDSTNCIWDATTSGNGGGTSFVDINGTTYYEENNQ